MTSPAASLYPEYQDIISMLESSEYDNEQVLANFYDEGAETVSYVVVLYFLMLPHKPLEGNTLLYTTVCPFWSRTPLVTFFRLKPWLNRIYMGDLLGS